MISLRPVLFVALANATLRADQACCFDPLQRSHLNQALRPFPGATNWKGYYSAEAEAADGECDPVCSAATYGWAIGMRARKVEAGQRCLPYNRLMHRFDAPQGVMD